MFLAASAQIRIAEGDPCGCLLIKSEYSHGLLQIQFHHIPSYHIEELEHISPGNRMQESMQCLFLPEYSRTLLANFLSGSDCFKYQITLRLDKLQSADCTQHTK